MSVKGLFSSMSMPDVIQWARTAQRSGMIVLRDDLGQQERKLVLDRGKIVACSSSSPREYFGRYLTFLGLTTNEEVDTAIEKQRRTGMMLASLLVESGRLTREQAIAALEAKTVDIVTDVFFWKDGTFQYDPHVPPIPRFIPIEIDPIDVTLEGVRRTDEWNRLRTMIHPATLFERTQLPMPARAPLESPLLTERIAPWLDGQTTVQDLVERLPLSRFRIYAALGDLLAHGLVKPGDGADVPDQKRRLLIQLEEARTSRENGRFVEALEILQGLVAAHPGRDDLARELTETAEAFRQGVYRDRFRKESVPFLTISPAALTRLRLSPADGFLLSRIDGRLSVSKILQLSAVKELDALRILVRLIDAKVIEFQHPAGS